MNQSMSKKMIVYILAVLVVFFLSVLILTQVITNMYVLLAVFVIDFLIFIIMLFHFFDKYIKPVEIASRTMDKVLQGNYHARVNQGMSGTIGELSKKINALARNLSELTIQEQIQAEQLSTIIENSESALMLVDEKGYIHVVNRKFISIFGKTPRDYIGHIYYDVIDYETIHHTVQETFLYESRVKQLFSIMEEEKTYLEIVGAPIFNERNMLKGAVLVIYDITEFKRIELMRKDFVANVSHELKTPITSIHGFAETLLEGTLEDQAKSKQIVSTIYEETSRIQTLIDDLLILSSLEKEETHPERSVVHASRVVEDVMAVIQQKAIDKHIRIVTDVDEQLAFSADEHKLKQILLNLMMNGITYTPEHGEVSLEIKDIGDGVRIRVKDTGIGISKLALPRIFERFYRVDKDRSRDTGGTGLGLAIVKHIVEVHHGDIDVDSELDKGTCFTIDLPKEQSTNNTSQR